ncbi:MULTISPECIES: hypothetical protein [unclassified Streptomyces]|uniref:hypothetical protein n=1 Tax=unclassified Streptomyces TaxID=2593676 RepID=UPI000A3F8848|nr:MULTISPECIES: hypothetical protein [unclassified Streptomyces]
METLNSRRTLRVLDPFGHHIHQDVVIDVVEASFDVLVDSAAQFAAEVRPGRR